MNNTIKCLDHGFVKLRNMSGPVRRVFLEGTEAATHYSAELLSHDSYVIQESVRLFDADDTDPAMCARISFDNLDAERTREQDLHLYEYLIKNRHSTPVEMIEVWLEMKLPIFIARQFVRHRTATINEISARYTTLPAEWYIPEIVGGKAVSNKQGQEDNLEQEVQDHFQVELNKACKSSYDSYLSFIKLGVAPEHARMFLHVNMYTHWIWKQDLHNLMHFLALRLDSHAQIEARIYATAIYDLLKQYLPKSMELFDEYRRL